MGARRDAALRISLVVACGLAVVFVYAYPGYMAFDSVEQLDQARSGVLTDWHPPLMSALWGWMDRVIPGPLPMLLLQCGLFLVGMLACLERRLSTGRAGVIAVLLFAFPPTIAMMGVVLKDSLMCGLLLSGVAGVTSSNRWARGVGLGCFGLATGLRHNALAAILPLMVLLCPWPVRATVWRKRIVGAGIAIALVVGASLGNALLTDTKTHPFHYSVAPMDFVGVLNFAPDLSDEDVRALFAGVGLGPSTSFQQRARNAYDPNRWWGDYIYGDARIIDEPSTPQARDAVTATWWRLLRTYPLAYTKARLDMFRELLGLTDVPWTAVYAAPNERWTYQSLHRTPPAHSKRQKSLAKRMVKLGKESLVFRPYPYFILAIILIVVMRRDAIIVALLSSALCYTCALLVITPAPDIRYTHWLMVCVCVAFVVRLLGRDVARRLDSGHNRPRAERS